MPRYYMNLRYRDRMFTDDEGDELPDDVAARRYALESAQDLIRNARLDVIRNWYDCSFEITDETSRMVVVVPFTELPADEQPPHRPECLAQAPASVEDRPPRA